MCVRFVAEVDGFHSVNDRWSYLFVTAVNPPLVHAATSEEAEGTSSILLPETACSASPEQTHQCITADCKGAFGFFHPFANGGGGGERVLW